MRKNQIYLIPFRSHRRLQYQIDKYKSNIEDTGLPNTNFCFTDDYFKAQSLSRHHSNKLNAWRKINELEVHEVVCKKGCGWKNCMEGC